MNNWTEIICILDRSGSMGGFEDDTIGGFNAFLERQRAVDGRARLTLVLFDDRYELLCKHTDLENVEPLSAKSYFVRGSTALLDAVGKSVNEAKGWIDGAHPDERPENVIVLVVTDGYENASKEYTGMQIRDLVAATQADGWEYVFLGADIDAFQVTHDLAMAQGSSSRVPKSAEGIREAYGKLHRAVSSMRTTGSKGDVDADLEADEQI